MDHYEVVNGKRRVILASITRDTKQEALRAAYAYKKNQKRPSGMTVGEAVDRYIEVKAPVLSPSTLRGYESHARHSFGAIADLSIDDLRTDVVQEWISAYSLKHSPKSVANARTLLSSAVSMFVPDLHFKVTLPQRQPPTLYTPTDDDVRRLIAYTEGTEMERAILLAAFGTLRRGEVCALERSDIEGNAVSVSKSIVRDSSGTWLVKRPKTPQSNRTIVLPSEVVRRVLSGTDAGRLVSMTPGQLTDCFRRIVRACGLPPFRFHDLRAYAVSMRHALGVPDQYIMQDGGYKSDRVMKQAYRRAMADKQREFSLVVNSHIEKMLSKKEQQIGNNPSDISAEVSESRAP